MVRQSSFGFGCVVGKALEDDAEEKRGWDRAA